MPIMSLTEHYAAGNVEARVVRFEPEEFPAVMVFPEAAPVEDQVKSLLADPNLSQAQKNLVDQIWNERERRKRRVGDDGTLYINANNPIIQALAEQDLDKKEISNLLMVIYANAMMFGTQGTKRHLSPDSSRTFFKGTNQIISSLMDTMHEVQKLRTQQAINSSDRTSSQPLSGFRGDAAGQEPPSTAVEQTEHITCLVALPFSDEYNVLIEALRDVLAVAPYFWDVRRADERYFENNIEDNVVKWIDHSQCFAVDLSERNDNVMMELGYMHWRYPDRPLILLQREGSKRLPVDLGTRLYISYSWGDVSDRGRIAKQLRDEIKKHEELKNLRGMKHYLSEHLLRNVVQWIPDVIAKAVAEHYNTVEDFVNEEPDIVVEKLKGKVGGPGTIKDIQGYLRDVLIATN